MVEVAQFTIRVSSAPGLPGEIAAALWQKGVRIEAFSAELHGSQEIIRLTVDKAALAKRAFDEHGWAASEESESLPLP